MLKRSSGVLWPIHDQHPREWRCRLGHRLSLGPTGHDHQTIQLQRSGTLGHLAVKSNTMLTELQHGAKDRKAAAWLARQ